MHTTGIPIARGNGTPIAPNADIIFDSTPHNANKLLYRLKDATAFIIDCKLILLFCTAHPSTRFSLSVTKIWKNLPSQRASRSKMASQAQMAKSRIDKAQIPLRSLETTLAAKGMANRTTNMLPVSNLP